jgi:hypothetical protein
MRRREGKTCCLLVVDDMYGTAGGGLERSKNAGILVLLGNQSEKE